MFQKNSDNYGLVGKRYLFWRVLNLSVAGLFVILLFFCVYFVQDNFKKAIVNTAVITNMQSNLNYDVLDLPLFDRITKRIDSKSKVQPIAQPIKYIFIYGSTKTTYGTTTKTP
ncbi:MAG: hypothetical protein ABH832_01070 [bacterium]